ncbi:hypothetical protein [Escherichia coli]
MSTLNTRKDRDRNGKAKLHNHSGIPTLTGKWRHPSMDCWVNYSTRAIMNGSGSILRFAVAQMIDANVIG